MQALFFKIDFFFIPRKGMHTYTFLILRKRSVTCGAFLIAFQLFNRKKKKPLLKRILDGSRVLTPLRLIKNGSTKIKTRVCFADLKGRPCFLFFSAAKQFLAKGSLNSSELSLTPVGHTSFARRETGKCAFLFFLASQSKFHFEKWYNLLHHFKFR